MKLGSGEKDGVLIRNLMDKVMKEFQVKINHPMVEEG
jgi:hypothetical protein